MVIRPACLYADEAWGHYAEWCWSPCVYVSEYMRVIVSASTRVSAVALRCIMHVRCVCAQNIHDEWYNTDECRSFCGIQRDPFKVKWGESDGEGIGNSDQRDIQRESKVCFSHIRRWQILDPHLTLLTIAGVFPIQGFSAQIICPNDPLAWVVYRHRNVDDWIRISPRIVRLEIL